MLEQWIVVHNCFVLDGKLFTRVQGQRATMLPHAWPATTPSTELVRQASQEEHHAMATCNHMYAACAVQRRYHVIPRDWERSAAILAAGIEAATYGP